MFRIRFHGRGGQGMKTAANMLGSAFFHAGFEVQDAPRYGAERRGAPMVAYVRAARGPIHERGEIAAADLVVVADETLLDVPAAAVLQGADDGTVLLVAVPTAAAHPPWPEFPGTVLTLPMGTTASGSGPPGRVSAACAGAAARLVGVVSRDCVERAVETELGNRPQAIRAESRAQALAAFDALAAQAGVVQQRARAAAADAAPQWIRLARDQPDVAAPDIVAEATSEGVRTGLWRSATPWIDLDHCSRCSWVCTTFCPDSAIHAGADRTPRIDYDHCKGCLVCVTVCPAHAIRAVPARGVDEEGRPA